SGFVPGLLSNFTDSPDSVVGLSGRYESQQCYGSGRFLKFHETHSRHRCDGQAPPNRRRGQIFPVVPDHSSDRGGLFVQDSYCWMEWRTRQPAYKTLEHYRSLHRHRKLGLISVSPSWHTNCLVASASLPRIQSAPAESSPVGSRRCRLPA